MTVYYLFIYKNVLFFKNAFERHNGTCTYYVDIARENKFSQIYIDEIKNF